MGYEKKLAGSIGGRVHLTVSVKGPSNEGKLRPPSGRQSCLVIVDRPNLFVNVLYWATSRRIVESHLSVRVLNSSGRCELCSVNLSVHFCLFMIDQNSFDRGRKAS